MNYPAFLFFYLNMDCMLRSQKLIEYSDYIFSNHLPYKMQIYLVNSMINESSISTKFKILTKICSNTNLIEYFLNDKEILMNFNFTQALIALYSQKNFNKKTIQNIQFLKDYAAKINQNINYESILNHLLLSDDPNIIAIKIVSNEIDPNTILNPPNQTVFSILCNNKVLITPDIIQFFIDKGADVNKGNPLYNLCKHDDINLESLKLLLDHGADANQVDISPNCVIDNKTANSNDGKETPLSFLCSKQEIKLEVIRLLLDHGADPTIGFQAAFKNIKFNYPLTKQLIRLLLKYGADVHQGFPLCQLCKDAPKQGLNQAIFKLILEYGGDINEGPYTPLYYFCLNINAYTNYANLSSFEFLVQNGVDLNKDKVSPLFLLSNFTIIKYLIDNGADINQTCKLSEIEYDYPNKQLLHKIFDAFSINEDSITCSIFSIFIIKKNYVTISQEMIKYFIERADLNLGDFTPLCSLCCLYNFRRDLIDIFIDNGADINLGKITPLGMHCMLYSLQKLENVDSFLSDIEYLIEHGSDINKGDITPLSIVCSRKLATPQIISFFLSHGSDVNQGYLTPLCALCSNPLISSQTLQLLLDHGSDVNQGDPKPISILKLNNYIDRNIISLLENHK